MQDATAEPLIWTTKGNLPVSSLAYQHGWQDSEDATVFWEEYRLGDEIVKRNVHAMSKRGVAGESAVNGLT
jgi:hypothetical protein